MNNTVVYTIIITLIVVIIILLYFMFKTLKTSGGTSSSPTPTTPSSYTPPPPSSSPTPTPSPYIVDYKLAGTLDSSGASSIANSLNQYLALNGYQNGILYYVIWVPSSGSCSHATIIYASQSAFNSLNSQVENILAQHSLFGIVQIDYQSPGPCSTIAQIIPSTATILAVNGMCT